MTFKASVAAFRGGKVALSADARSSARIKLSTHMSPWLASGSKFRELWRLSSVVEGHGLLTKRNFMRSGKFMWSNGCHADGYLPYISYHSLPNSILIWQSYARTRDRTCCRSHQHNPGWVQRYRIPVACILRLEDSKELTSPRINLAPHRWLHLTLLTWDRSITCNYSISHKYSKTRVQTAGCHGLTTRSGSRGGGSSNEA